MTEPTTKRAATRARRWPIAVTLLLLGGIAADQALFRVPAADAAPYHARVQAAASRIPLHIGTWFGKDVPVPPAATKLLKPNVIASRRYEEMRTGKRVDFLLVQCTDTRDILGHYPPVCYVAHGWTQESAEPRDWDVDGLKIPGTVYVFSSNRNGLPARMTVYNFIVLPDGQICRGMGEADAAAQDLRRKFLGAAQVQLVFDGAGHLQANDDVLKLVIGANRNLIDTIRQGMRNENE
jgi:hypothetical protein